jgi:hypothetical protein
MKKITRNLNDSTFRNTAFDKGGYYLMRRVGPYYSGTELKPEGYQSPWCPVLISIQGPEWGSSSNYASIKHLEWGELSDQNLNRAKCEFIGPIDDDLNKLAEQCET